MSSYIVVENPKQLPIRKIREKLKEKKIVNDIKHLDESYETYAYDLKQIVKTIKKLKNTPTKLSLLFSLSDYMFFIVKKDYTVRPSTQNNMYDLLDVDFDIFEIID